MKITVNLADLTSEQVKCLSQLGAFRDEQTWEAGCDPEEFREAVGLLKGASWTTRSCSRRRSTPVTRKANGIRRPQPLGETTHGLVGSSLLPSSSPQVHVLPRPRLTPIPQDPVPALWGRRGVVEGFASSGVEDK